MQNRVQNWSESSKGGFIDTGYVGYVQIDQLGNDCVIVETELSKCAGSIPMYALEDYILCHDAVEEVTCVPDSKSGKIKANLVKTSNDEFKSITTNAIISDLLEGLGNKNVQIDSAGSDQDSLDTSTRETVISFFTNDKVTLKFV